MTLAHFVDVRVSSREMNSEPERIGALRSFKIYVNEFQKFSLCLEEDGILNFQNVMVVHVIDQDAQYILHRPGALKSLAGFSMLRSWSPA